MDINMNNERGHGRKGGLIVLIILLFLLMIMSGYLVWVSAVGTGSGEMPNLFGMSFYISQGDSAAVPAGSAIVADRGISSFNSGEAVVYYDGASEGSNKIFVAYFGSQDENGSMTLYDASGANPKTVAKDAVRGRAKSYVGVVGTILAFAQSSIGLYILSAVTVLLLCAVVLLIMRCAGKRHHNERFFEAPEERPSRRREQMAAERRDIKEDVHGQESADPSPFGLRIDDRYGETAPPASMPDGLTGSIDDDKATLNITGSEKEMELLARLVDAAIKKRGQDTATLELTYAEVSSLNIVCDWQDVGLVSAVVAQLKRRLAEKQI